MKLLITLQFKKSCKAEHNGKHIEKVLRVKHKGIPDITQNFSFYLRYSNIRRKIILFLLFNTPNGSAQSDIVIHIKLLKCNHNVGVQETNARRHSFRQICSSNVVLITNYLKQKPKSNLSSI